MRLCDYYGCTNAHPCAQHSLVYGREGYEMTRVEALAAIRGGLYYVTCGARPLAALEGAMGRGEAHVLAVVQREDLWDYEGIFGKG